MRGGELGKGLGTQDAMAALMASYHRLSLSYSMQIKVPKNEDLGWKLYGGRDLRVCLVSVLAVSGWKADLIPSL
jgi:hypothetical protein